MLNLVGSLLLAASAYRPLNLGVLILETAWAAISLGILLRPRPRDTAGGEGPQQPG